MGRISKNAKIYPGSDGQSIYQNALILAKYLRLDRLYIHGHSIDITIRKGITQDEQLVIERKAMYHAKQRVVEWLTGQESTLKTPDDKKMSSQLKRKGFEELTKLGRQITANLDLDAKSKATILKELYSKGYYRQPEEEYSLIAIPVKWIYGEIKGTTSVGDIGSYTNFVQSGL